MFLLACALSSICFTCSPHPYTSPNGNLLPHTPYTLNEWVPASPHATPLLIPNKQARQKESPWAPGADREGVGVGTYEVQAEGVGVYGL